jgi:hypothetical protein
MRATVRAVWLWLTRGRGPSTHATMNMLEAVTHRCEPARVGFPSTVTACGATKDGPVTCKRCRALMRTRC